MSANLVIKTFTSTTSSAITIQPGVTWLWYDGFGGGGSGGSGSGGGVGATNQSSGGSGGGGSQRVTGRIAVTAGTVYDVTVGLGAAGASNVAAVTNGNDGTDGNPTKITVHGGADVVVLAGGGKGHGGHYTLSGSQQPEANYYIIAGGSSIAGSPYIAPTWSETVHTYGLVIPPHFGGYSGLNGANAATDFIPCAGGSSSDGYVYAGGAAGGQGSNNGTSEFGGIGGSGGGAGPGGVGGTGGTGGNASASTGGSGNPGQTPNSLAQTAAVNNNTGAGGGGGGAGGYGGSAGGGGGSGGGSDSGWLQVWWYE